MRLSPIAAMLVAMIAGPALAEQQSITFRNTSARAATVSGVYTLSDTGEIIDDNVGAMIDPILPGTERVLDLSLTRCAKVWMRVYFADGEEVTGTTDLCRNRTILLYD